MEENKKLAAEAFSPERWQELCKAFEASNPEATKPRIMGRNAPKPPTPDNMPAEAWELWLALKMRGPESFYHDQNSSAELCRYFEGVAIEYKENPQIWAQLLRIAKRPKRLYNIGGLLRMYDPIFRVWNHANFFDTPS